MEPKKFVERPNRLVRKPAKKYKRPKRRKQSEASIAITPGTGPRRLLNPFQSAFTSRPPRITRQMSEAITDGNFDKVREILDRSANIEDFEDFLDILHQACATENMSTVAVLLRHGACVNAMGKTDRTPLHIAVKLRNLAITSLLLSYGANTNIGTKFEKRTALHIAAGLSSCGYNGCGSSEMIRLLCEHGARVNQGDIYGTTPLHIAARQGHIEAIKALLDHKADIDKYDNDGWTALHIVSVSGNEQVARLLIKRNANINCQNKYGRTPLHWACAKGHIAVVQLLLEGRADPKILDHHNRTALDHAENFEAIKALILPWIEQKQSKPAHKISLKVNIDNRITRELCTTAYVEKENLLGFFSKHRQRSLDKGASETSHENIRRGATGSKLRQINSGGSSIPDSVFDGEDRLDTLSNGSTTCDSGKGPSEATVNSFRLCSRNCASRNSEVRENCKRKVATLPLNVGYSRDSRKDDIRSDFDTPLTRGAHSLNGTLPNRVKTRTHDDIIGISDLNISDKDFADRQIRPRNGDVENSKLCCQLATADETFQTRTLYIDKMLSKILTESQRALKDDNPTLLSEGLQNTHKEMQSLQNFMHDFRSQMSSQFNTLERVATRDGIRVDAKD